MLLLRLKVLLDVSKTNNVSKFIRLIISLVDVYMCPSGWAKFGMQSCSKRLDSLMTWHKSLAECEKLSDGKGSLASIHSLQEMNLISNVLDKNEAWIGLNDIDNEGFYNWTDGSPLVYASWGSSKKDISSLDPEVRDCVAATKRVWLSRNCAEEKKSVCLMPASKGARLINY